MADLNDMCDLIENGARYQRLVLAPWYVKLWRRLVG